MADLPNLHMPDVSRGPSAPAAEGQPVPDGYGGMDAPTHPDAQATDPGTPPRFTQPSTVG